MKEMRLLLLLFSIVVGGGCMATLKPELVDKIDIRFDQERERLCANLEEIPIEAIVRYQDGTRLKTWIEPFEFRVGKIKFGEFVWQANYGKIDSRGLLILPEDRLSWLDQELILRASLPSRPELAVVRRISPDYGCGESINYSGSSAGFSFMSHGKNGEDGPYLNVALGYLQGRNNHKLVLARIINSRGTEYYVFDPKGKTATILADGGSGGNGEDGSSGEDGRDGRSGSCFGSENKEDGQDGQDGSNGQDGGDGGNGGRGGIIEVVFDAAHPELSRMINFSVDGGSSGNPGSGGRGGSGGSGGSGCGGGSNGSSGDDGQSGRDGDRGRSGASGRILRYPGDVRGMFSEEILRGVPIVMQ